MKGYTLVMSSGWYRRGREQPVCRIKPFFIIRLTAPTSEPLETPVPLAEPEEEDPIVEGEKPEGAWAHEWVIMAHRLVSAGVSLSLPVPEGEKYFASLPDILPFAPYVASLYR